MFTVIIISSHGFSVIQGTQIHCVAKYNTTYSEYVSKSLYNERGQMVEHEYVEIDLPEELRPFQA